MSARTILCFLFPCCASLLYASASQAVVDEEIEAGILNVRLVLARSGKQAIPSAPTSIQVHFPSMTVPSKGTIPSKTVTLPRIQGSGSWGIYEWKDTPANHLPFVNYPDQWDSVRVGATTPKSLSFLIDEIEVTFQVVGKGDVPGRAHTLVRTTNTPYPVSPQLPWVYKYHDDFPLDFTPSITASSSGWSYDLTTEIMRRRQETAKRVVNGTYGTNISFASLPRSMREAAYDIGQTGSLKVSNGQGGGCSVFQAYYQCNFTSLFMTDFPGMCACAGSGSSRRCWGVGTPWPYSRGIWNAWEEVLPSRSIGMINFHNSGGTRDRLFQNNEQNCPNGCHPIVEVVQSQNKWVSTGLEFVPKAGDLFWRMENCWHESSDSSGRNIGAIPHAMTLLGNIKTYNDASGFRIGGAIWDGELYELAEPTVFMNEYVSDLGFDEAGGRGCAEPTSDTYLTYKNGGGNPIPYCRYCGQKSDGAWLHDCQDAKLYCPRPPVQGDWYFRRDYFIGESM